MNEENMHEPKSKVIGLPECIAVARLHRAENALISLHRANDFPKDLKCDHDNRKPKATGVLRPDYLNVQSSPLKRKNALGTYPGAPRVEIT